MPFLTPSAVVEVKPSRAVYWYFFEMLEDSVFNRYLAEDGGGLEQYFADRYAAQCATSGMDFYWHIRTKVMLNRGERSIPYLNDDASNASQVTVKHFTTLSEDVGSATVAITPSATSSSTATSS